jgi:acetyl esterase/lipase
MSEDVLTHTPPPAQARIAYGPDPSQFGDLRLPDGSGLFPLAILLHGGYWRSCYDLEYFGHGASALAVAGVATWNVEYRRLGMLGGGWPGTFLDVAAAADYAPRLGRDHPLDVDRIVAVGHSAGGHLACWLAGRSRIAEHSPLFTAGPLPLAGVVVLAGLVDLRRAWQLDLSTNASGALLGGGPDLYPERYAAASPIELLPMGVRQVLLHGTAVANVPFELSERFARAATAAGDQVQFVALPDAGHFELVDPSTAEWDAVPAAVRSVLTEALGSRRPCACVMVPAHGHFALRPAILARDQPRTGAGLARGMAV